VVVTRLVPLAIVVALAASPFSQAQERVQPNPEVTSGYICPMHPNIVSATEGKCSLCGMALVPGDPMATAYYDLKVDISPRAIKPGAKARVTFNVFHPLTGERITDYAEVHDKRYHLFVISRDMKYFSHEHPEPGANGIWTFDLTLPQAGHYILLSDFLPTGGGPQMIATPLVTAGYEGDLTGSIPQLEPDAEWNKETDGVKVELTLPRQQLFAGEQLELPFQFTDAKTSEPIHDLQRYLGAFAHALIVSEDLVEHIHTHPHEMLEGTDVQAGGGPEVVFDAFFPTPGRYRAWVQFQRNNKLSTIPFTFEVPPFTGQ
jgi:Heavy metal binding domain